MSQLYQEDYLFKAYFFNLYDKEIEVANTDEIVDAAQKLLINFTITENERQRLQLQNQIKDCKIKELELQIIQQNFQSKLKGPWANETLLALYPLIDLANQPNKQVHLYHLL